MPSDPTVDIQVYHITPRGDLREHRDEACPCNPQLRWEGRNLIVIHNSYDGRELLELDSTHPARLS